MTTRREARFKLAGAVAVVGIALFVAACGSSTSNSSSPAASSSPSPYGSTASAKSVSIGTAKGSDGTYLTGASGRALYLWVADSNGKSSCSGACAKAWPPLTATATPSASGGVNTGDLGTITRSDGSKQVTYKGHPLYYFVGDSASGQTRGQGSNQFGAKWWLVGPSGSAVVAGGSTSASSSSSSSSSAWG